MLLWTIQTYPAWQELKEKGVLRTAQKFAMEDFEDAYKWMITQMEKRLGPRPPGVRTPLWAWYQWEEDRKRPDLRSSAHLPPGEKGVRIEFEIKEKLFLLSDFQSWHYVLNYCYLSETEGELFEKELEKNGLSYYRQKPLPDPFYHKKIEKSWERIFNISSPETTSIQATFWELHIEQVKKIKVFKAR